MRNVVVTAEELRSLKYFVKHSSGPDRYFLVLAFIRGLFRRSRGQDDGTPLIRNRCNRRRDTH